MVAKPNAWGIGQPAPSGVSGVAPKIAPSTTPPATQPVKIAFALRYAPSAKRSITRGSKLGRSWAATRQKSAARPSSLSYAFRSISDSMKGTMAGFLATVLICDDEPSLRELIRISLDGPYQIVEADDGEESLEIARRLRPDVVILDMMMPRRSGLEVLTALRKEKELSNTRIIVLTAQPAAREDALREGADVVMVKPFEPEQIAAAVKEVLADRR